MQSSVLFILFSFILLDCELLILNFSLNLVSPNLLAFVLIADFDSFAFNREFSFFIPFLSISTGTFSGSRKARIRRRSLVAGAAF